MLHINELLLDLKLKFLACRTEEGKNMALAKHCNSGTNIYQSHVQQLLTDIETAIVHNDVAQLQTILGHININEPLNEKQETLLMVAIKLSCVCVVQMLLEEECDLTKQNINNYSPFDIAIITTFDNRQEPRHSICWKIIAMLMRAGAEPACPDAMLYVFRTALKNEDAQFVNMFISMCIDHSSSQPVHELLLLKLHRNQPLYMVNSGIDDFLEFASLFTTKLIRISPSADLANIISTFVYYLESHWTQNQRKHLVFQKLVLYTTVAGWKWSSSELVTIRNVSSTLSGWCKQIHQTPRTLAHLCRLSFRSKCVKSVEHCLSLIMVPDKIKDYITLHDIDILVDSGCLVDLSSVKL